MSAAWHRFRRPVVVAVAGALVTLAIFMVDRESRRTDARAAFERGTLPVTLSVQRAIDQRLTAVESVRILFAQGEVPERWRFDSAAAEIIARHPGVAGVAWAPRVSGAERGAYESNAKADGLAGFTITEASGRGPLVPAGRRSEYVPLYYATSQHGGGAMRGFDLASEPNRAAALARAAAGGRPAAAIVRAVDGAPDLRASVAVPVYAGALAPTTAEQRRRALRGFVVATVRLAEVMTDALRGQDVPAVVTMVDPARGGADHVVARIGGREAVGTPAASAILRVADRQLAMEFRPAPGRRDASADGWPIAVLGVLVTAGFVAGVAASERRTAQVAAANERLAREVAERERVAGTLVETDRRYRLLAENIQDVISIYDMRLNYLYVSPSVTRLRGYTVEEVMAQPIEERLTEASRRRAMEALRGSLAASSPGDANVRVLEVEMPHKDGSTVWVELKLSFLRDETGRPTAILSVARDITRRRREEARTKIRVEMSRQLDRSLDPDTVTRVLAAGARQLLGARSAAVYLVDTASGDFVLGTTHPETSRGGWPDVLARVTSVAGLATEEARALAVADVVGDPRIGDLDEGRRLAREASRALLVLPLVVQERLVGVVEIVDAAGREFDQREVAAAQAFADQAAIVLENARLHGATRRQLRRTETLLAVSQALGSALDVSEACRQAIRAVVRGLGADAGVTWRVEDTHLVPFAGYHVPPVLMTPEGRVSQPLEDAATRAMLERETTMWCPDGGVDARLPDAWLRPLAARSILIVPLRSRDETVGSMVIAWRTQREALGREERELAEAIAQQMATALQKARLYEKLHGAYEELSRTQSRLVQAQKMEAVGSLAGGVAHDFNNLLTIVAGRAQLLRASLAPGDPRLRHVDLIKTTIERGTGVTRQLLAFSRQQVLQPHSVELPALVTRTVGMLRALIGEDITLTTAHAPDVWPVRVDPGQIEQVLMNLVVNARDAMPRGGRLRITTEPHTVTSASGPSDLPPGEWVVLTVSDTGTGIAPDTLGRIFEPFFTTKAVGEGTGLGLATVYGIVRQSDGHITVESELGTGTTFRVYLPRERASADAAGAPDESGVPQARVGETILVVEDEAEVRDILHELLTGLGYSVLTAHDGVEALDVCARPAERVDLVLTDVIMPRMSGPEAVGHIRATRPAVKILCMSGYTDNAIARHGAFPPDIRILAKPFDPDDLARVVRRVLDGVPVEVAV